MKPTYTSLPKQSTQQIMPGMIELRDSAERLQAIASNLSLTPAARLMLDTAETRMQQRLQRRLRRLVSAQRKIAEASEILRSLSSF
jgi:hypothetical protein